ncbi:MAG: hypothetical protein R3202_10595, partial [Candidatus Competibacterales bacterium]|nr:hypothetical protein [Candidatus Competibacterales bacterium]
GSLGPLVKPERTPHAVPAHGPALTIDAGRRTPARVDGTTADAGASSQQPLQTELLPSTGSY